MSEWIRVRKGTDVPICPICGRDNWCMITADGTAVICARISIGAVRQVGTQGAGYLHRLAENVREAKYVPKRKPKPGPPVDWWKLVTDSRKDFCMEGACALFGLSAFALDDLLIGWDTEKNAHTFPMKDGRGNFIGIRLRLDNGKKFSVPGSKNGLFWPLSVKADSDELFYIGEGPTDTAALLDLGFQTVGRASCGTGYKYIKTMIEHYNRQVVIFADKDQAKYTPDGKQFYPGYDGGLKLARSIKPFVRSVRLIKPPQKKDIRAWYQAGCTREAVMALVKNSKFI